MSSADDDELIADAKNGDRRALTELYSRHWRKVRSWIYFTYTDTYGLTAEDARQETEDALQDTFEKALNCLGDCRCSFQAWIHTISFTVATDRLRKRKGGESLEGILAWETDEAEGGAGECRWDGLEKLVSHEHETWASRIVIKDVLLELPPKERQAFFLMRVSGIPSHEVAEIVGEKAPSTIRARVAAAHHRVLAAARPTPITNSSHEQTI